MLTLHADIELVAGDEWSIDGTLLDADDAPLVLDDSVQLGWTLLDSDAETVADLTDYVTLTRVEPVADGKVNIVVSATLTRSFNPGRYTNAIRAWVDGAPALMWRGRIGVAADPFWSTVTL